MKFWVLIFNLSIYDGNYELAETKYQSPIADDAISDYNYKLLDTLAINGRQSTWSTFKIKGTWAAGLEGILYIDQENYAIAKAILRIKDMRHQCNTWFRYITGQIFGFKN
jgi:hypothetical protein